MVYYPSGDYIFDVIDFDEIYKLHEYLEEHTPTTKVYDDEDDEVAECELVDMSLTSHDGKLIGVFKYKVIRWLD